jgi:hypothetical protein
MTRHPANARHRQADVTRSGEVQISTTDFKIAVLGQWLKPTAPASSSRPPWRSGSPATSGTGREVTDDISCDNGACFT